MIDLDFCTMLTYNASILLWLIVYHTKVAMVIVPYSNNHVILLITNGLTSNWLRVECE